MRQFRLRLDDADRILLLECIDLRIGKKPARMTDDELQVALPYLILRKRLERPQPGGPITGRSILRREA